jgi:hypothetical protein
MRLTTRGICAAALMAMVVSSTGRIDAEQAAAAAAPTGPMEPLKVTVTISRFEGDKKTASLPFVMWVNTGKDGGGIRMTSEVPVPSTTVSPTGEKSTSYSYRNLGTNIDCSASALGNGMYRLVLSVEDSQIFRSAGAQADGARAGMQNFRATNQPILRDGQTVQFAVATDKTSGEVIKLDVTLTLVK